MSSPPKKRPQQEAHPYAGRWVARLQGQVVGQGGTPSQALHAAKNARFKEIPKVEYVAATNSYSLPPIVAGVRAALPKNQEIYLVGGAVRDLLLGQPLRELDFALPGKAIPLGRRVAKALGADFYPLDESRDAGRVILQDEGGKRLTLDFISTQGKDIDSDLAARDLTINAMAIDLRQPEALLDPLGGAADLAAKRLRACSPEAFSVDPVRVLRTIRMAAAFSMKIEKETRQRMRAAAKGFITVSPERLRDEFFKLLQAPRLATSLRALELLGALEVMFPELNALKDLEQPAPHVFDVLEHSFQVVDKLEMVLGALGPNYASEGASDLHTGLIVLRLGRYRNQISQHLAVEFVPERPRHALLLFAGLMHDLGKATTRSVDEKGRIHFYEHEARGGDMLAVRAAVLHLSNTEIEYLRTIASQHMRPMQLTQTGEAPTRGAIYRFFRDAGTAGVDICLLSLADLMGKYGAELPQSELERHLDILRVLLEAYYEQPEKSVSPPVLLNGDDLMRELDLKPSPKVGEILEALREAQASGEVNDRAQAVALAKNLLMSGSR